MKKAVFTKNGMKQIIDTGYKLFDKQTTCLTHANCITDTMIGFYIRPYSQTECNGEQRPKGHLMELDLQGYELSHCPEAILAMLKSPKRTESVKFYQFCVYPPNRPRSVFGFGLCTADNVCLAVGLSTYERWNHYHYKVKKFNAIKAAMQYVSDLTDSTTLAPAGHWEQLSTEGKTKYDLWVENK